MLARRRDCLAKVKIIGAGSIGNHLSNAARTKGWHVTLCDIDADALARTREQIYPARYGAWDENIELINSDDARRKGYDFIFIGTPPDSHVKLALEALQEEPKAILIEKPLATPDLAGCEELYRKSSATGVRVFVGYDHVVARSTKSFVGVARSLADVQTLDVSFREHWQGIFNAHPWLDGPHDTYLGYWRRGGGALGEHSHALNLWQHIALEIGAGRVVEVTATLDYVIDGKTEYDRLALLNLRTENGLLGRVVQDVVTQPSLKWVRIQGVDSAVEWQCIGSPYQDVVRRIGNDASEEIFSKTRPDDFIQELNHLEQTLATNASSPISIERGLDSMMVVAAAHLSSRAGAAMAIDYARGYTQDAIGPVRRN
jgi:predicted dehydrogenase